MGTRSHGWRPRVWIYWLPRPQRLWDIEGFRRLVPNAIVRTSMIDVPKEGVESTVPREMLEESRR